MPAELAGIFVGGASKRMGGRPKGLLTAPDTGETLVARLIRIAEEAGMEPVLVGDAAPYAESPLARTALADAPDIDGPLGGLAALLENAGTRPALAIACDMPFVSGLSLTRLAQHAPDAVVVAPRRGVDAPWEPLFARYTPGAVLPILKAAAATGVRSFQALFARLDVVELPLDSAIEAALRDWDTPEDVSR